MSARAGHHEDHVAERRWREHLAARPPAALVVPPPGRVVVCSAHPDDDVLAVGGLLQHLAAAGHALSFVVATDGEGSHPGSPTLGPDALAVLRRRESDAALVALGLADRPVARLGLPDSGLDAERLAPALSPYLRGADVVLAPWRHDGHPDHEAVGLAAAAGGGAVLWEYPVWAWHWATPEDDALPWTSVRIHASTPAELARKRDAVGCFASQVAALSEDPRDVVVLPPEVLAHFERDVEAVVV